MLKEKHACWYPADLNLKPCLTRNSYQNLKKWLYSLFAYFLTYKQVWVLVGWGCYYDKIFFKDFPTFCIISQENGVVFQYHYYLKKEAQVSRELNSTVKGRYQFEPVTAPRDLWWGSYAKRVKLDLQESRPQEGA